MTKVTVAGAAMFGLLACAACDRAPERFVESLGRAANPPAAAPSTAPPQPDFIYGRVTTDEGAVYEGRMRWGGDEEALWGNYFNGYKKENPWVVQMSPEDLPKERVSLEVFGITLGSRFRPLNLDRQFMARFGDIALIEPHDRDIRVTLKSGSAFVLNRFAADDLADGLRVWDATAGVVELGEWHIRTIEFSTVPPALRAGIDHPLYGTVRTPQGDFTGLIQWDGDDWCTGSDEFAGRTAGGEITLRFENIRSIARNSGGGSDVTMTDGRTVVMSGTREKDQSNRGIYVDDPRYGRVLVLWSAFERVDFSPAAVGPTYADFPPGQPLKGSVVTRSGRRVSGRLVYDLDESETTETLDAPAHGVTYNIPLGLIASIAPPAPEDRGALPAKVRLHSGEELQLESSQDLGEVNAGMLIFTEGSQRPEYVSWDDVERVEFEQPAEMYPSRSSR